MFDARPRSKPWGLWPNELVEEHVAARGAHSVSAAWVKGHATPAHVEEGITTSRDRHFNGLTRQDSRALLRFMLFVRLCCVLLLIVFKFMSPKSLFSLKTNVPSKPSKRLFWGKILIRLVPCCPLALQDTLLGVSCLDGHMPHACLAILMPSFRFGTF